MMNSQEENLHVMTPSDDRKKINKPKIIGFRVTSEQYEMLNKRLEMFNKEHNRNIEISKLIRIELFGDVRQNVKQNNKQDVKQNSVYQRLAIGFFKGFDKLFKSTDFPDTSKKDMYKTLSKYLDMNKVQELKKQVENNGRMG